MHNGDGALRGIDCVHFVCFWVHCDCLGTDERASCSGRVCLNRNGFLHRTLVILQRAEPEYRVLDQLVLDGTAKYLVAVAHVHIEHLVFGVGPHYREVATGEHILKSNWIIRGIQSDEYSNRFIQARAWFPDIPLVVWRLESGGKVLCYRMGRIIDTELGRQWRPTVGVKYATAEEIHEPRPVGIFIVVGGHVKAEPCASAFHIFLKGALLIGF